jgi:hypothetical protein
MIYTIEYDIPPLRGIYLKDIEAFDKEMARMKFYAKNPLAKIRKIYIKGMF